MEGTVPRAYQYGLVAGFGEFICKLVKKLEEGYMQSRKNCRKIEEKQFQRGNQLNVHWNWWILKSHMNIESKEEFTGPSVCGCNGLNFNRNGK